jgi:hypothetical protein
MSQDQSAKDGELWDEMIVEHIKCCLGEYGFLPSLWLSAMHKAGIANMKNQRRIRKEFSVCSLLSSFITKLRHAMVKKLLLRYSAVMYWYFVVPLRARVSASV